jgi:two-component system response regulator GlrR
MSANWPGNVRELENAMEYAVAMATDEIITPELIACSMSGEDDAPSLQDARKNFEKEYLADLMARNHGNVSQAAKAAGKYRADFYELLHKHGLDPEDFRGNG